MNNANRPRFDESAFSAWFEAISALGATADGGVNRPFGSAEEREVRAWLLATAHELGLHTKIDAIGNIWGTRHGTTDLPPIVIGSHHDSVPFGGRYDGPLGVLVGLAVISAIAKAGLTTRHPLAFVSFTAEEPNPFALSTLGSRTVAGKLAPETLLLAQSPDGTTLREALAAVGGNVDHAFQARLTEQALAAFLELHIEQGLRLIRSATSLGIVTGICGIYRERVTITGEANHAGTTLLTDRHDALLAGAQLALAVEEAVAAIGQDDVIGTVGTFTITPGAINVIPGTCDLMMELRSASREDLRAMLAIIRDRVDAITASRGVQIERTVVLDQADQPLDESLQQTLRQASADLGITHCDLFSMAGHDAAHIASFTKAAMLFVPSVGGKSHCAQEFTPPEDIAHAANVLIETVLRLDETLDAAPSQTAKGV